MLTPQLPDHEFYKTFRLYIPQGIYYEPSKTRWRVRLYKEGTVIYRKYFRTFDDAYEAYKEAKIEQSEIIAPKVENLDMNTRSTLGLINSINLLTL